MYFKKVYLYYANSDIKVANIDVQAYSTVSLNSTTYLIKKNSLFTCSFSVRIREQEYRIRIWTWLRVLCATGMVPCYVPSVAVRDPVPFWPLDPGSRMGKKLRSGSGLNILDHISESLETIFWVKQKLFDTDADPEFRNLFDPETGIRDTGWKNSNPGSAINIPDPQHCTHSYHSYRNGPVKYPFPIPYGIHLYYAKKILVVTTKV